MIIPVRNIPIFSSTTFDEEAERKLISGLLDTPPFESSWVQRRLASYPCAIEAEKEILILELMGHFWKLRSNKRLFQVFRDFDSVFTILEIKGHFIHQFEVFLLGWHLIGLIEKAGGGLVLKSKFGNLDRQFDAWLLTSTAHDFGYPSQVAKELSGQFARLYNKIHMRDLSRKYRKLSKDCGLDTERALCRVQAFNVDLGKKENIDIEDFILDGIRASIKNKASAEEIQKILKEGNKDNHGYISALILSRACIEDLSETRKWKAKTDYWRIDNLKRAAASVAIHAIPFSHRNYIKEITFNSNPLAYLLLLIDNLQEWNRSLRPSKKWPSYNLTGFQSDAHSLALTYTLRHEKWTRRMEEEVEDFLDKKSELVKLPIGPNPLVNFEISATFSSDHGARFEPITLAL